VQRQQHRTHHEPDPAGPGRHRARQRLAETALRLFAEQGYAQTSVEEIAREAQFGVTTFFRHFPTKEDVAFYDQGNWMDELPSALAGRDTGEVWTAVRDATLDYVAAFQDPGSGFGPLRRALWLEEPPVTRRFAEISLHWETVIARVLAERLGLDADDPYPRMAGAALIGAARAALWHQHHHGGSSMIDHARTCLSIVEPCLRRPPAPAR
jgi:AcrR family transcriptional regulator